MRDEEGNIIVVKSFDFALMIIDLFEHLRPKKIYSLADQVLRSGTSIGANVKEAIRGQSKADFIAKLNISLKEASETEYWLDLLYRAGYYGEDKYTLLQNKCTELIRILTSIIKSSKSRP